MNLLSSTYVFSFFTLLSRILGYLRDILIAIFLGASVFADAFFVAFRLPNTFRRLFAEGTFNAAFIPSYVSEKIRDEEKGKKFADEVLSILILILFFIVLLVEIFTPYVVYLIAPGFFENSQKFSLAVELTRITFPFLIFVSLSSFFSGILNSNNKFAVAASAPIILNIILIVSLIVSYFFKLNFAKQLSYAVTLAGAIQLLFLIFLGFIGFTMAFESAKTTISKYRTTSSIRTKLHQHSWIHGLPFKIRFHRSKLYISAIPPIIIGFFVGMLSALMGVGGGFIMIPAMVYILGMSTNVVVGTSLFQIIFVTANSTFFQSYLNQTVDIVLAALMIVGGVIGAQIGARIGTKLKAEYLRGILAILVLIVCAKIFTDLTLMPSNLFSLDLL